jgi:hypothetical protein
VDEPMVIDGNVVASVLERYGLHRMAAWARGVQTTMARNADWLEKEQAAHNATRERLHKYEPPQPPRYETPTRWTGD